MRPTLLALLTALLMASVATTSTFASGTGKRAAQAQSLPAPEIHWGMGS